MSLGFSRAATPTQWTRLASDVRDADDGLALNPMRVRGDDGDDTDDGGEAKSAKPRTVLPLQLDGTLFAAAAAAAAAARGARDALTALAAPPSRGEAPPSRGESPPPRGEAPRGRCRAVFDWWGPFGTSTIPELPFEASAREVCAFAKTHWKRHAVALISLHASIVLWVGLWDMLTFCALALPWVDPAIVSRHVHGATYLNSTGSNVTVYFDDEYDDSPPADDDWLDSEPRNVTWVLIGFTVSMLLDTFHSNGLVPGSVGGRFAAFWEARLDDLSWRWPRALLSYAAQVMMTCGLYNLANKHLWAMTVERDVLYAVCGLTTAALVDVVYTHAELVGRDRPKLPDVGADGAVEFGRCMRSKWDLSLGTSTQMPLVAFLLACVSYLGQVSIWVGFDNLLEDWPYSGVYLQSVDDRCVWGCALGARHWYHQLFWMILGLGLLLCSGTLLNWSFVVDRLDSATEPHVHAFLVPPNSPSSFGVLFKVFLRTVFSQMGYYVHLSGFWYLIDEDVASNGWVHLGLDHSSVGRNVAYVLSGFVALYASGCFWADAM
ncbi:hypothetical protein M885DRAFT_518546 [Pelagophyceae sp. CCMP2097]|nr:hypothetical protein M885DRAFT_518546 [Pelagophyceae sp. CCMP2097]